MNENAIKAINVTPYAGVWIEIKIFGDKWNAVRVTPYAGVWIEICNYNITSAETWSLPTRECGLK